MRRLVLALSLVVASLLGATPANADVLGVDTSNWQHPGGAPISWNLLSGQGYTWAVMKAVQGSTYTDPSFAADWVAAGNAGLIRGAYDFANPTARTSDAVAEARHFVAVTGPLRARNTLPPVLDLEASNGLSATALVAWTKAWLAEAQRLTGRRPIIYTGSWFWTGYMGNSTAFTGYPLWIAAYRSTAPPAPGGWPNFTMWQYASTGRIKGISASVDLDRFAGTPATLARLANGTATIGVNPFGSVTVTRVPQGIAVDGWAVDPDTAQPVSVTVSGGGTTTTSSAKLANTQVATTWPWYGAQHGFHVVLPAVAGTETISVVAANVGAGVSTTLPSQTIAVGLAPVGVASLVQVPGGLESKGWVLDPDSAQPVTVHLTIDGVSTTTGSAALATTATSSAWPGYGSAHGFDVTTALPTGTHTICLTADNLGLGTVSRALSCTSVTKYDVPIGAVSVPAAVPGGVAVTGWALDDSSPSPTTVVATLDGVPVTTGAANLATTLLPVQYAAFGTAHGLAVTIPVGTGTHDVCVEAVPVSGTGPHGSLGCATVTRQPGPVGKLTGLTMRPGHVVASGWLIDPDTAASTSATLTVDGRPYVTTGASAPSSDASHAMPAWGAGHGFVLSAYLPAGIHQVCVTGTGSGAAGAVGCRQVTVSPDPFGAVSLRGSPGVVSLAGWALDPSTSRSISVLVAIDGRRAKVGATMIVPGRSFGVLGSAHSFQLRLFAAHGRHVVRVYALNRGAGHDVLIRQATIRT